MKTWGTIEPILFSSWGKLERERKKIKEHYLYPWIHAWLKDAKHISFPAKWPTEFARRIWHIQVGEVKPHVVVHVYNPSTDKRREHGEFEATLGYIERLWPLTILCENNMSKSSRMLQVVCRREESLGEIIMGWVSQQYERIYIYRRGEMRKVGLAEVLPEYSYINLHNKIQGASEASFASLERNHWPVFHVYPVKSLPTSGIRVLARTLGR